MSRRLRSVEQGPGDWGADDDITDSDRLEHLFTYPDLIIDRRDVAGVTQWRVVDERRLLGEERAYADTAREAIDACMRGPLPLQSEFDCAAIQRILVLQDDRDSQRLELFIARPRMMIEHRRASPKGPVIWAVREIGQRTKEWHESPRQAVDAVLGQLA